MMSDQASLAFIGLRRAALAALAALAASAALATGPAGADEAKIAQPSWMKADAAAKKVTMDIAAGWNGANGALNFNGYYDGNATVVVPAGWTVQVEFINKDGVLPHSILVTKPYAKAELPEIAGRDKVAIPRAYSRNPDAGIGGEETDSFRFTADPAGEYLLLCGAPGHAVAGMWIRMSIRADAKEPGLAVAAGAPKGRE